VVYAINLGMSRIGGRRELKRALESYWKGALSQEAMLEAATSVRKENWDFQASLGVNGIPSNDFSLYDHMLDACCLVGAVPERFARESSGEVGLESYFAMARGASDASGQTHPLEMTKWFDTNYHYLVPELAPSTTFQLSSAKPVSAYLAARELGYETRPVVVGPVTFLSLAKSTVRDFNPLELLPQLVAVYRDLLVELRAAGALWVQFDEPLLVTDLTSDVEAAFRSAYAELGSVTGMKILLATYFGSLGDNAALAAALPVDALHVDASRDRSELATVAAQLRPDVILSAGVIDGRNVWRTDLRAALDDLEPLRDQLGADRLWVGPSCSLLHVPVDLDSERAEVVDGELRSWLAFGRQKLAELAVLARGLTEGRVAIADELANSDAAIASRGSSTRVHFDAVRDRLGALSDAHSHRTAPYEDRIETRRGRLNRPILPTTTIGSFPQTREIRLNRQHFLAGKIDEAEYRKVCEAQIEEVVRRQEALGIDVLVHGEAERDDMVQYFAEHLSGFLSTEFGWVQSYGTRCVRPPIIFGDVTRPAPITRPWIEFAQSLTDKPMKGMLTGPVTILKWSFVRDDQPLADTCRQIALAIRDEVEDLEGAGIKLIQVDEPALREGLPLRRKDQQAYFDWATESFRLATSSVADVTEIHTHMCYVEFSDLFDAIRDLDVDAISIEAARSGMSVLDDIAGASIPNQVGPGVYDIHAPLTPSVEEMVAYIERAVALIPVERLWVNPDCGLKTRTWEEVLPALENMVAAASSVRDRLESGSVASS
jgi:5-methyltetrahydropteroyltriglutamate--homocysteine methyltransferase